MDQILKGGVDMIVGGGAGAIGIAITFFVAFLLVCLMIFMKKNPPSSLFGQIFFVIGILVAVSLVIFTFARGVKMVF
jgi:hypothetical protein